MTEDIRDKLLALIRCGMDMEIPNVQLTPEECDYLFQFARNQSIRPILYRGLYNIGISNELIRDFGKECLKDSYLAIQHETEIYNISTVLEKAYIPYILLKGAVLRHLYPEPELRTSSDIDVLVKEDEIERAVQILESHTDFRTYKKDYHDISMVSSRVHLELHFNIKANSENIDQLLSRAWDYAEPISTGSVEYRFTPEYQVFYVTAHMSRHFLQGGLGIRPFLDLWLLRNKTTYREELVRSMCAEGGIMKFYEECINLAQAWFEKQPYTETTAMLEKLCLSGGVFGAYCNKNAARQRKYKGLKYLAVRVFPPIYELKELYKDENGRARNAAYYYLKRLASWFGKNRREELKRQIKDVLSTDPVYQSFIDQLYDRLDFR